MGAGGDSGGEEHTEDANGAGADDAPMQGQTGDAGNGDAANEEDDDQDDDDDELDLLLKHFLAPHAQCSPFSFLTDTRIGSTSQTGEKY